LVLSFLLTFVVIASSQLGIGGMPYYPVMVFFLMFAMAFMILDTQLIIHDKYGQIGYDEYVFASMKLFADFVLMFVLLI